MALAQRSGMEDLKPRLLMHIYIHKGCPSIKVAVLTVVDVSRDTVDWLHVDDPPLLDMVIFRITGLRIEALHGEHQHGLMALMVLSQGIVCGQYVATELA